MQRILIIEDDEDIARALQIRLEAAGFSTTQVHDAVQAAPAVQQGSPDMILLDYSMPGGNGLEVARRIRALPEGRSIPITFLTAYREPGVRAAIEREGYHCIEKPYDSRELVGHIRDELTPGAEAS